MKSVEELARLADVCAATDEAYQEEEPAFRLSNRRSALVLLVAAFALAALYFF